MHAHSNPAEQGPLGFESTKTRTARPCKENPESSALELPGRVSLLSRSKERLARELPRGACVLAARFPLATWTETRHDVHTVKSRGYNVNQLWEYELDPAVRALREEPSSPPR